MTVLPPLAWMPSPNESSRHGAVPYLIVLHRPVGAYGPSISWLRNPAAQASAHVITEGNGTGVDVATQLVPWDRKAWACRAFNSVSYNLEVDDDAWNGRDPEALRRAERLTAFLCHWTGIPAIWSRYPLHDPGLIRHYDLGLAGGGHTDPTMNEGLWLRFVAGVRRELSAGGFREQYGRGVLLRI